MVEELTSEESDAYFGQRPRGSQIGAWASQQSRPIGSREELETQYAEAEERFEGTDVPRPPYWGGIRVVPERIEFWQEIGKSTRLNSSHVAISYAVFCLKKKKVCCIEVSKVHCRFR